MTAATRSFGWWFLASVLLGLGTAMVYPTLIASVSDASHPSWQARSLSIYRFWRDLGYAVGAAFAVLVAEELFVSGCRLLFSITSAGQILPVVAQRPIDDDEIRWCLATASQNELARGALRHRR